MTQKQKNRLNSYLKMIKSENFEKACIDSGNQFRYNYNDEFNYSPAMIHTHINFIESLIDKEFIGMLGKKHLNLLEKIFQVWIKLK